MGRVLGVGAVLVLLTASAAFAVWPVKARDLYTKLIGGSPVPVTQTTRAEEAPPTLPEAVTTTRPGPSVTPVAAATPTTPSATTLPKTPDPVRAAPVPAAPPPAPPVTDFTFLRNEAFTAGGAQHTVPIYRSDKLAGLLNLPAGDTAVDIEFVLVPAGSFTRGSPDAEGGREAFEGPQHVATMPAFMMARTETSQRVWEALAAKANLSANPSSTKAALNPVDRVVWDEAWNAARVAGLRLPSESEWEYACRAGTSTPFAFGANVDPLLVNYKATLPYGGAAAVGPDRSGAVPVGSLPPNAFGLHEMPGNVNEWCQDTWQTDLDRAKTEAGLPSVIPWRLSLRVARGGSWAQGARHARSAQRDPMRSGNADGRQGGCGMRLARSLVAPTGAEDEARAYLMASRIAHYPLETDGADVIGGNHPMFIENATFGAVPAPAGSGNALHLLGAQRPHYTALASVPSIRYGSFSVALEFYPRSIPEIRPGSRGGAGFLSGGTAYRWFNLELDDKKRLVVTLNNGALVKAFEDTSVEAGTFHTVLVSVDLEQRRVLTMLDGKRLEDIELPADFALEVIGTNREKSDRQFTFRNHGGARDPLHGYVRHLRIYGRSMSADALKALSYLLSPP